MKVVFVCLEYELFTPSFYYIFMWSEVGILAPALTAFSFFFFLSSHQHSSFHIFLFIHTQQHNIKAKSTFFGILKICNTTRNEQAWFRTSQICVVSACFWCVRHESVLPLTPPIFPETPIPYIKPWIEQRRKQQVLQDPLPVSRMARNAPGHPASTSWRIRTVWTTADDPVSESWATNVRRWPSDTPEVAVFNSS